MSRIPTTLVSGSCHLQLKTPSLAETEVLRFLLLAASREAVSIITTDSQEITNLGM